MSKILNFIQLINQRVNYSAKEREYQHVLYGIFSFIGFISFYFFNAKVNPDNYENFAIRSTAAILAFLLIIKDFWPKSLKIYLPTFWNITLLYNLPFFFTFMLLKNDWSPQWQMNELMALTILTILTDLITLSILAPLGISIAWILYYTTTDYPAFPDNVSGIITSYITILIFCALFTFKKDMFFQERLKLHNKIQELNNSLEEKVKTRTIELEKALAAKTEFLNNMSHEIRTPIQGFTSLSEGLVEHWKSFTEDKRISLAQQVSSSAQRLGSLVGGLLDLSKFNANKMVMEYHEMDLNEEIKAMIRECKDLYLNGKNIQIYFDNPSETIIQGDNNRLAQVLRNLFANAIKFTPENGTISISLKRIKLNTTESVHFTIKDSGIGIPADETESIFDAFTQSSITKTKAGGTGLGLSICKEIISSHKGKIWAENNKDIGSSLHFIIPISQSSNKTLQNTLPPTTANILMIDDEDICLSSMELLILNTPYTLVKSDGGISGLEYIKNNHNNIDVILLDLMMPDIYGLTLLEEMKKNPETAKIPVILQSGTSDQIEIQKAYTLGISSFISKPYKKDIVLKVIEQAIKNSPPKNIN